MDKLVFDFNSYRMEVLTMEYLEELMWATNRLNNPLEGDPDYIEFKQKVDQINLEILSKEKYAIIRDKYINN